MNKIKYYLQGFIALCLIAFGYFLRMNTAEQKIEIKHGPITIEKSKPVFKPSQPIIKVITKTIPVYVGQEKNTLVFSDSIESKSDSLNYKIKITSNISLDSVKAKNIWDTFFQLAARQDTVFKTKTITEVREVPIPFYKNHWFYATMGAAAIIVKFVAEALSGK